MKVIGNYRADLRLDLKDSGAIWSDAELDRCVERAVADLTRFRPLEKSAEFIVDATVSAESFTTPEATDPDYFVDDMDISASVDGSTCTLVSRTPDVPRPVKVSITDAKELGNEVATSIHDLVIIVKGRDVDGNYMEEYFYLADGLVQTGKKYFAAVTEVEIDEIDNNGANDKLDVGTGTNEGVFVQLANKPIQFNSDAITGFTRYADYIMDYYNGRIAMKTGGTMVVATAYNIAYTKSKVSVDISDLTDLIRVERVEYPVGTVPEELSTKEVWGSILTVTSVGLASQAEASDKQHVLVHYLAQHQIPGASSPGTYPSFLDWTVELAASAYALFIEALQHELAAVTAIGTATTGMLGALANAETYLIDNTTDDAESKLAAIATDIALLRDAIHKDGTPDTGALFEANALLLEVSSIDLDVATVGAVAWLLEGELLINTVNLGENVPALFAEYAKAKTQIGQTRVQAALGLVQEASARLSNLRTYLEEAGAWTRISEDFLAQAVQYKAAADSDLWIADRYREEAIERRNEAWAIWSSPPQYAPQYTLAQRAQPKE